jgi:hypothetical protein
LQPDTAGTAPAFRRAPFAVHHAEVQMHGKMSAGTRRRYIEYIVNRHTGVTNPNWWGPPYPEQKDKYQEWALARESSLRAELEAMSDDALLAEFDRCNNPREQECINFMLEEFQQQERQDEFERMKQYQRGIAQKGGCAHRSIRQPPQIMEACKDMYAKDPKMTAKEAHKKLSSKTGHEMPDGRVIQFEREIAFESFRTRYWTKV